MIRFAIVLSLALVAFGCGHEAAAPAAASSSPAAPTASSERHAIMVDASGYHPASVEVQAGAPTVLVFTRTSDEGCGQQLVFPDLGIQKDLPLDTAVEVPLTPERGEIRFTCGMNMLRGTVVAR